MDALHHVAIGVHDLAVAVSWYRERFDCAVSYQDDTWALLRFENILLALVIPGQHPPHIAFTHPQAERFGPRTAHRDGTRSIYIADPAGNAVEILDRLSVDGSDKATSASR